MCTEIHARHSLTVSLSSVRQSYWLDCLSGAFGELLCFLCGESLKIFNMSKCNYVFCVCSEARVCLNRFIFGFMDSCLDPTGGFAVNSVPTLLFLFIELNRMRMA